MADLESSVVSNYFYYYYMIFVFALIYFRYYGAIVKEEDKGNDYLISINGTNFRAAESGRAFYSFKFKKSTLQNLSMHNNRGYHVYQWTLQA